MATATELADIVNGYTRQQIRQHNQVCTVAISENELGASMSIQDTAAQIEGLTGADRVEFESRLNTASGGEKKSHYPC